MEDVNLRHVLIGLIAGFIIIFSSYLLRVSDETLQALLTFNIFFVCMLFPLNGSLERKLIILLVGNAVCFIWSTLFSMFVGVVSSCFGDGFNALFLFLNPLLNLLWIVSFWSTSLTFLVKSRNSEW